MSHEHHAHMGLRIGFEIAKLAMKAAMVAAAVCTVKEIHKVHKAIDRHRR